MKKKEDMPPRKMVSNAELDTISSKARERVDKDHIAATTVDFKKIVNVPNNGLFIDVNKYIPVLDRDHDIFNSCYCVVLYKEGAGLNAAQASLTRYIDDDGEHPYWFGDSDVLTGVVAWMPVPTTKPEHRQQKILSLLQLTSDYTVEQKKQSYITSDFRSIKTITNHTQLISIKEGYPLLTQSEHDENLFISDDVLIEYRYGSISGSMTDMAITRLTYNKLEDELGWDGDSFTHRHSFGCSVIHWKHFQWG